MLCIGTIDLHIENYARHVRTYTLSIDSMCGVYLMLLTRLRYLRGSECRLEMVSILLPVRLRWVRQCREDSPVEISAIWLPVTSPYIPRHS